MEKNLNDSNTIASGLPGKDPESLVRALVDALARRDDSRGEFAKRKRLIAEAALECGIEGLPDVIAHLFKQASSGQGYRAAVAYLDLFLKPLLAKLGSSPAGPETDLVDGIESGELVAILERATSRVLGSSDSSAGKADSSASDGFDYSASMERVRVGIYKDAIRNPGSAVVGLAPPPTPSGPTEAGPGQGNTDTPIPAQNVENAGENETIGAREDAENISGSAPLPGKAESGKAGLEDRKWGRTFGRQKGGE